MNKKGQSILSEYVMIFFVVVAAATPMTIYVQRGLQARLHDARNYMINAVTISGACDANCMAATGAVGNQIPYEYEPYYSVTVSNQQQNEIGNSGTTTGSAAAIGAVYIKTTNEATQANSTSYQLPACASAGGGC